MKLFKLKTSYLQLFSSVFLLLFLLFSLCLFFRIIPGNYAPVSITYISIFTVIVLNNFFWWWAVPYYSYIKIDSVKIVYKYLFRKPASFQFNEIKSVFFYNLNNSQLVLIMSNGKKEYIPLKVKPQKEFIGLLKEALMKNNLFNSDIDKVFAILLGK